MSGGGFGGSTVSVYPGESKLFSSIFFFLSLSLSPPFPSAIHFPLPTLHFLLSFSTIGPKSSFWIQGWSGFMSPLPTCPIPTALAPGRGGVHLFWPALSMTLETKLTMAEAGWLGSSSAKRWQALSVVLPCFRATKPKSLRGKGGVTGVRGRQGWGGNPRPSLAARVNKLILRLKPLPSLPASPCAWGQGPRAQERILSLFRPQKARSWR